MIKRVTLACADMSKAIAPGNLLVFNVLDIDEPWNNYGGALTITESRGILGTLQIPVDGPILNKINIDIKLDDVTGAFTGDMVITRTLKDPVADPLALMQKFDEGPNKRVQAQAGLFDTAIPDSGAP